ncbi:MAG TPA: alpha/beta hydrolase [Pirellulales bacterium]|jgi:alpha-beta hydrolase superfamily lysophospholipase
MQTTTFTLNAADGVPLRVYRWLPEGAPQGVVQIAHGWAEHAARYARLAEVLCGHGYGVYAHDHRGHGHTARTSAQLGFLADRDGWQKCIDDLWRVTQHVAAEHPDTPIFGLGHSLGSFMMQQYISEHGEALTGVALSATNGKPPAITPLGIALAYFERLRVGAHGKSKLLHHLTFEVLNKSFEPARTPFDWLSRDASEVDKYVADPLCGFASQVQMYIDVLRGLKEMSSPRRQARIPKSLPIYIFYGSLDPVATNVPQLLDAYRVAGLRNVTSKVYPEARHEVLNEINRDEVTRDLLAWLAGVRAKQPVRTSV